VVVFKYGGGGKVEVEDRWNKWKRLEEESFASCVYKDKGVFLFIEFGVI